MSKSASFYETIDQIITHGVQKDILHLFNEDYAFNGNYLQLRGKPVVNFASYDYLGLNGHPEITQAVKKALDPVNRFPTLDD